MPTGRALPPCTCSPANFTIQDRIESFYQNLPAGGVVSGLSVGVVQVGPGGSPVITKCYSGYANVEEKQAIDNDTVFEIGSTTKTFTTTMLAAAVRAGVVDLNEKAQTYYDCYEPSVILPVYIDPANADMCSMTILDLADYTSGIPNKSPTNLRGPNEYPYSLMHEYLGSFSLPVRPGTQYKYVNTNFAILTELLMLIGGFCEYQDALEWLLRDADLSMSQTGVVTSNTPSIDHLAQGYRYNGDVEENYAMDTWPAFQGAGGIYSTIDDMLQWLQFNMGLTYSSYNDLLPVLHEVRFPKGAEKGQGLGWFVANLMGTELKLILKNGDTGSFHSWIGFLPEVKTGAVLLCNTSMSGAPQINGGGSPVDNLGEAILKAIGC